MTTEPAKTGRNPDGTFGPGNTANVAGKPRGARHKTTLAIEALLEGEAEKLTRVAIDKALGGDPIALRLCFDRICPPRKGRPVSVALPPINGVADLASAQASILGALADGELTSDEAADAARVLEVVGASIERRDLEARISALEQARAKK